MTELKKTLGSAMLWGLGVGHVISGMYFGWNLGLDKATPLAMLFATILVILLYTTFTFCYAELATLFPKAGGGLVYAQKGLNSHWGVFAGVSQWVEFIFAPPVISMAIGTYLHLLMPSIPILTMALISYFLFIALNIYGVSMAAGRCSFEFGRVGFAPKILGHVHKKRQTPHYALVFNMLLGIIIFFTNKTGEIITLSCFGVLTLYIISSCAHLRRRYFRSELKRPFKTPLFPLIPIMSLFLAIFCFCSLSYYYPKMLGIYCAIHALLYT